MPHNRWTTEEIEVLLREYLYYRDRGALDELAKRLRRRKAEICRKAGTLGLTDPRHPKLYSVPLGSRSAQWKGDRATAGAGRSRARARYERGKCEECDAPALDRHHVDGDTLNNVPSNVRLLCRFHHMKVDGRLEAFRAQARAPRPLAPLRPCIVCKHLSKPLRRGKCHTCNEYFRRHGVERQEAMFVHCHRAKHG